MDMRPAQTGAAQEVSLLPCDVVMKGGITSGVVYPPAVSELAKTYRFVNVGGASAGAIAAACTAAAEFRRQNGDVGAFSGLDQLSRELGADNFILNLFQPTPWTWPLFQIVLSFVGSKPTVIKIGMALVMAFVCFWPLTLVALFLDWLLVRWLLQTSAPLSTWLLAMVVMLVVLSLAWAVGLIASVTAAIPNNYLGLCSGSGGSTRKPPLTDWLAAKIDQLADIKKGAGPLTFGQLWGVSGDDATNKPQPYGVLPPKLDAPTPTLDEIRGNATTNLEMITTCVTLGRPYRIPIATRIFFVNPADAYALFPKYVATWLLDQAAPPRSKDEAILYRLLAPLVPLPPPECFPVVVAARMSLSFPVLLSAVKLYAIDYSRPNSSTASALIGRLAQDATFDLDRNHDDPRLDAIKQKLLAEPCWFSDGGLTRNFPVEFFDGPLPRRPTFAIDLDALPDGESDTAPGSPADYVKLPEHNIQGIAPTWNRIERQHKPASLLSFVGAIIDTMQNWTDNTQSQMPGYRDRIVHIELAQDEGGLNLNMPANVVQKLAARGQAAGSALTQAFADPPELAPHWLNHRFVRYRNFMALFEPQMTAFHEKYSYDFAPGPSYETLIGSPPSYKWQSTDQEQFAKAKTTDTDRLAKDIAASSESFLVGEPHPQGELIVRPVL